MSRWKFFFENFEKVNLTIYNKKRWTGHQLLKCFLKLMFKTKTKQRNYVLISCKFSKIFIECFKIALILFIDYFEEGC